MEVNMPRTKKQNKNKFDLVAIDKLVPYANKILGKDTVEKLNFVEDV